jgi:hypothetical protein
MVHWQVQMREESSIIVQQRECARDGESVQETSTVQWCVGDESSAMVQV